jgi:ubiquinone/menaquinone biosynthesis C-methylase UbiE
MAKSIGPVSPRLWLRHGLHRRPIIVHKRTRGSIIPERPVTLPATDEHNTAEIAYWNGPGGERWLNQQQTHDKLLARVAEILLERTGASVGEFVLDIGCGCGATSIALAHRVAPTGRVLGADVSSPMLDRARQLVPKGLPIDLVLADAMVYPFESGRADLLCSRFGVMFFADPVRSFVNMRRGLRRGARLGFACWREPRRNSWAMLPLQEAYRHVPRLPEVGPEDPGPFSFASEHRVRTILERAGFDAIEFEPIEMSFDLALSQGLEAAVDTAMHIGPTSRALDGQPPALRAAAAESIRAALARYEAGGTVPLPGALWIVSAKNP